MITYLQDEDFTLYHGDALETLRELPDESVHMCVTSPPFYGLRDYGTGSWEGGDEGCDHAPRAQQRGTTESNPSAATLRDKPSSACKCGARRVDRQIGLEATPDEWVAALVAVFREVRRVLRSDGSLWVEVGDSYAGVGRGPSSDTPRGLHENIRDNGGLGGAWSEWKPPSPGTKAKDLIGAPWLLAFALRADGWWLRSDIVWARPNPMPESVTDRPTKSHSYVFLLSKSARYFFDHDAIREPHQEPWRSNGKAEMNNWSVGGTAESRGSHETVRQYNPAGRNVRSVWTIPTEPLPDEHYAAFPQKLVERCVLAGCPEDGVVLDPFMGSGTTALVARRLGRKAVGVELSGSYCAMAARRTRQLSLLATEGTES